MAGWTTPIEWRPGDSVTPERLNEQMRDNMLELLRPIGVKCLAERNGGTAIPTLPSGLQIQYGRGIQNWPSSGGLSIVYPVAFGTATVTIMVTTELPAFIYPGSSVPRTGATCNVERVDGGSLTTGTPIPYNWLAIGY